jgi:hypothetical protein
MEVKLCTIEGCQKKLRARGMCTTHYERERLKDPGVRAQRDEQLRRWKDSSKDHVLASSRQRSAGFSRDMVRALRVAQGSRCAVCAAMLVSGNKAHGECADHYETLHGSIVPNGTKGSTKHPRGLLCKTCNYALGLYERVQRPNGLRIAQYEDYLANPPVARLLLVA